MLPQKPQSCALVIFGVTGDLTTGWWMLPLPEAGRHRDLHVHTAEHIVLDQQSLLDSRTVFSRADQLRAEDPRAASAAGQRRIVLSQEPARNFEIALEAAFARIGVDFVGDRSQMSSCLGWSFGGELVRGTIERNPGHDLRMDEVLSFARVPPRCLESGSSQAPARCST